MYIKKIHIESFGAISGRDITIPDGADVPVIIEGANESGKSTVAAFIKFVLYGFSGKDGDSPDKMPEKKKYMSFSGSPAGGYIVFSDGKKDYRVERSTAEGGEKAKGAAIFDVQSGLRVLNDTVPGYSLLGVDEETYESTVYLRQLGDSRVDGEAAGRSIENILFSGNEKTDTAKAQRILDSARRELKLRRGSGGLLDRLTADRDDTDRRLTAAREANINIFELEEKLIKATKSREEREKEFEKVKKLKKVLALREKLAITERVRTDEMELEKAENMRNKFLASRDFIPDAEYRYGLTDKLLQLNAEKKKNESAREDARRLGEESAAANVPEQLRRVREAGGCDSLRERHTAACARVKKLRTGLFAALLAAVLFAILAVILGSAGGGSTLPALLYACAGACVAAAALLFAFSCRSSKRAADIRTAVGAGSIQEFEQTLDGVSAGEKAAENALHSAEMAAARERLCADNIAEIEREVNKMLERGGFEITGDAGRDAQRAADASQELIAEHNRCDACLAEKKATAAADRKAALGIDREAVESELASLGIGPHETIDAAKTDASYHFIESKLGPEREKESKVREELVWQRAQSDDPVALEGRLYELETEIEAAEKRLAAYELAGEAIGQAALSLRGEVSPQLAAYAGEMMGKLTDGRHRTIFIDNALGLSYEQDGYSRAAAYFSAGTRDLAYFSLRLALINLLYSGKRPPLIFDESFAHQDNKRTENMLSCLCSLARSDGQQSLIFTCHGREAELLERAGLEYLHIIL